MNAIAGQSAAAPQPQVRNQAPNLWTAGAAVVLIAAGLLAILPQLRELWAMWLSDALRSFGILVPPASLCLAVREWKREDWIAGGTWWGLVPITVALSAGVFAYVSTGVVLFIYFSGAVLTFGGFGAWRRAWFPLLLLLFVDPVPRAFEYLVDEPLQVAGARTARAFAHLIDVPVNGDALKLMFSPQLGIFIAPGCDGLRGAAALGYMALVMGYLYRMRVWRWAAYVAGAVVLAYLFNLIRLCGVIGYYWFALRIPVLGKYGAEIDYLIGGILFFGAAAFLLGTPRLGRRACTPS